MGAVGHQRLEKAAAAGSVDAEKELAVIARGAYDAPGELEAEALRNWGADPGNATCAATGGQWSGAGCYTPAGRPYDPSSGRCTGGGSHLC